MEIRNLLFKNLSGDLTAYLDSVKTARRLGKPSYLVGDALQSGYSALDEATGGFGRDEFIVIGASTSTGKTTFALNLARRMTEQEHRPVLYISTEESRQRVLLYLLARETGLPFRNSDPMDHRPTLFDDREAVRAAFDKLAGFWLHVLTKDPVGDTAAPNVMDASFISTTIKAFKACYGAGAGAVIVDNADAMVGRQGGASGAYDFMTLVSNTFRDLAVEVHLPILCVKQMSRARDTRGGKTPDEPRLSDLRDSGAWEQDASTVLLLCNTAKEGVEAPEQYPEANFYVKLGKSRNGVANGKVWFRMDGATRNIEQARLGE